MLWPLTLCLLNMANIFSQPVSYLFLFVSDRVFGGSKRIYILIYKSLHLFFL